MGSKYILQIDLVGIGDVQIFGLGNSVDSATIY